MQLNMISGFNINSIQISHLQYVDDTLVFLNASEEEAENLVMILQISEAITWLRVNFNKSSAISIYADHKIGAISEILKCKIESLPLKYLGMAVGATLKNSSIWDAVLVKFQKKLAQWKRNFYTKAGRVFLIQTSLSILLIYYMSIFQPPVSAERKLNHIMRNLLWGTTIEKRIINWVACERSCKPKKQGALGIRNLRLTNKALISKWSWRFSREKNFVEKSNSGENEDKLTSYLGEILKQATRDRILEQYSKT